MPQQPKKTTSKAEKSSVGASGEEGWRGCETKGRGAKGVRIGRVSRVSVRNARSFVFRAPDGAGGAAGGGADRPSPPRRSPSPQSALGRATGSTGAVAVVDSTRTHENA